VTARSFTETFTAVPDDLLADIDTWQRWNHGTGDEDDYPTAGDASCALSRVLAAVPDLIAQRDSARDWAAALEGQNAQLEAKVARVEKLAADLDASGPGGWDREVAASIRSALSGSDGNPE
jgi:hypothetical protein